MTQTAPALAYQGRQTRRIDGHARRQALLEAALRLVARHGIRGVRHRAVAEEAGVPLSATTYYFKDIQDLINDSFLFWTEAVLREAAQLQQQSITIIGRAGSEHRACHEARERLTTELAQFVQGYIQSQIDARADRLIEHAFRAEALRSPRLAEVVRAPRQALYDCIIGFLRCLGSEQAQADALIVMGTLQELEYQGSLDGRTDPALIEQTVRQLIRRLIHAD